VDGLLGYGPRIIQIYRDIAAGAIGLELPAGLVLRADRLIE
jgi:hypothetical protein